MALDVKRNIPLPYPFDLKTTPTKGWEQLDRQRLGMAEPSVVLVFRSKLIVTIPYRNLLTLSHYVPDQILLQFSTHEVRIVGLWMTDLYYLLVRGESCVVYEWREKQWGNLPKDARVQVKEIIIRVRGKEQSSESPEPETDDFSQIH